MSGIDAVETQVFDPLLYLAPLPHVGRYYPYGFPVEIATDMPEVLDAAQESFGSYAPRFDVPPIRVHVMVSAGSPETPPAPVLRGQRNLIMWVSNHENFGVCDHRQRFGYSCVTRATVADRVFFRWHFLDAVIYVLLELNHVTSLHGACVALNDTGVLLYGPSGVGKSTLSYACARRGWTYVSDDSSSVLWDGGGVVLGEPHRFRFRAEAPELFPELLGRTVGRPLGRKPTIEVHTAGLPIRTANEARIGRIVFLERRPGDGVSLSPVSKDETLLRFRQDMAVYDPDLEEPRQRAIEVVAEAPAYDMRYANYEDAVLALEQLVREGDQA